MKETDKYAHFINQLYLIGNGFDIHHNMKTLYQDFRSWLQKNNSIVFGALFRVYEIEGGDLWSSFEEGLGRIPSEAILNDNIYTPLIIQGGSDDVWLNLDNFSEIVSEAGYNWTHLYMDLQDAFTEWILELDNPDESRCLKVDFENSILISFNYTDTLQNLYKIPNDRILYIHGRASTGDDLIFGHNKTKDKILEEMGTPDSEETQVKYSEVAEALLSLYKDTEKIVKKLDEINNIIKHVDKIHIWGMSLSDVDLPYLQYIKHLVNNDVEWEISWYSLDDKVKIENVIKTLNLKRVKLCRLDDYT